jgi:hypothetical protein
MVIKGKLFRLFSKVDKYYGIESSDGLQLCDYIKIIELHT